MSRIPAVESTVAPTRTTPHSALADLLRLGGLMAPHPSDVTITGRDPVLPANHLLGTSATASLAAIGVAASELWSIRTGRRQRVTIDTRAAAAAIRSERYTIVDGEKARSPWASVSGFHHTRDDRWIQLHCNFPHHRDRALRVLDAPDDRAAVAAAVARRDGAELEDAIVEAGGVAALVRTRAEWEQHPHGTEVGRLPVLEVLKLGNSLPEPLPFATAPLGGVRVLDVTRVIAGPVAGRTLAQHGADVLRIRAEHMPDMPGLEVDTGMGKLAALLDLGKDADVATLRTLARECDVFSQGYRPGTIAARGFSPEALAALRPGIVCVSLCAWGHAGPWRERRGFDSLVQCTSGIVADHTGWTTGPTSPQHLPAQVLDHVSGYLMAFGAMAALARRAREGGSWLVRVSLCQTSEWLQRLGRIDGDARSMPEPTRDDVADLMMETDTPFGRVHHVAPVVKLSETPARWTRPSVPPGTHPAAWPPRGA